MQSQTKLFTHVVADYMSREMLVVRRDDPVGDLVARMAAQKASAALVVNAAGVLCGLVTEQDITARVTFRCDADTPVHKVMSAPVEAIRVDDYLYYAVARMRRFGWRHMPVIDHRGRPAGVIELQDALSVPNQQLIKEIENITHRGNLKALRNVKYAQVRLAEMLFEDNVPAPEILAILTHINNDIHRRVMKSNLEAMKSEGWGDPPVDFAVLIMGSGGRGENVLLPDQDNGFILADHPEEMRAEVDRFFIELAERFTHDLDEVGFPLCKGYVMATNPVWRKTLSEWKEQTSIWARKRSVLAIQFADIFFDFRSCYGSPYMPALLRDHVTQTAKNTPAFLAAVQREVTHVSVALGWFGRLKTEKEKPEFKGMVNLKHMGTLPLVSSLRLLCLREGIERVSTFGRIRALRNQGIIDDDEQDNLVGAFRHLTKLLLRQQIKDFKDGKTLSNYVHPDSLSDRDERLLLDSLKAIDAFQDRVNKEFAEEIF